MLNLKPMSMWAPDHVRSLPRQGARAVTPFSRGPRRLGSPGPAQFHGGCASDRLTPSRRSTDFVEYQQAPFNISPVAQLGTMWFLVGIPLAGLLTWRGWPGLAGLVARPYLLAQYLLLTFANVSQLSWRRSPEGGGQVPPVDPSVLD